MNLRKHVRQIQLLENKAAEKAGARFSIFEMGEIFDKKTYKIKETSIKYIKTYIEVLLKDIKPEMEESMREGVKLFNQINK